jgi:hypothetical protein
VKRVRIFEVLWYSVNIALIFAALFLLYSIGWEYSTRKYLRGFSDAIIPASATPLNKAQTILDWMAHGPERAPGPGMISDRDPSDTLNYRSLLRVCGTATNAFVNVANASGLPARRLLLLDNQKQAKHVVAEVFDGSRWVIVDPSFRVIPRGADGQPLTREELQNPVIFQLAIAKIPDYNPAYNYQSTSHLRLSRVPFGGLARQILRPFLPTWEDSVYTTLFVERESFAALVLACFSFVALFLARMLLRAIGEKHLGVHPSKVRERFLRAFRTFLHEST